MSFGGIVVDFANRGSLAICSVKLCNSREAFHLSLP